MRGTVVGLVAILAVSVLASGAFAADAAEQSFYEKQLDSNGLQVYGGIKEAFEYKNTIEVSVHFEEPILFSTEAAATEHGRQTTLDAIAALYLTDPMMVHLWDLPVSKPDVKVTVTEATVSDNKSSSVMYKASSVSFSLTVPYEMEDDSSTTTNELQDRMNAVKNAAKNITVTGTDTASKVKSIAKALGARAEFQETEAGKVSNLYDCLVDGKSMSAGFAAAFNLLCQYNGISSVACTGTLYDVDADPQQWIWNMVGLDGKYYLVDATVYDRGWGGCIMAGLVSDIHKSNVYLSVATSYLETGSLLDFSNLDKPDLSRDEYEYPDERPFYEKYAGYIIMALVATVIIGFMAYAARTGNI
jgi:hypothetical protein